MLNKALNHMTLARFSLARMLDMATETGCIGVEIRNDLTGELFDGQEALEAAQLLKSKGLRILALSEVSAFNDMSDRAFQATEKLAAIANECGAEAISLIPSNDGTGGDHAQRMQALRHTLVRLEPVLRENNVQGFIEPLGFAQASLRFKAEVVEVVEELEYSSRFKLVHDTFHHHLAGEKQVFPEHTGMVHISGVKEENLSIENMRDEHRALVDAQDVINNVEQLNDLHSKGYSGPVSMEAFSPQVHELADPKPALLKSFRHIESSMAAMLGQA